MMPATPPPPPIAVFYLVRGADTHHLDSVHRFVKAYRACPGGIAHDLCVIFKGFSSAQALDDVRAALGAIAHVEFHTADDSFDLGAYAEAIMRTPCDRACFLNTRSEPVSSHWLLKLSRALDMPGVGLAGASGSFEVGDSGGAFPNVHVRTNAFMLTAAMARSTLGLFEIRTKRDAHLAEHGAHGVTRQIMRRGLTAVIAGANGRAYAPEWWSGSRTFRQGDQSNLLVLDNQTRTWDTLTWTEREIRYKSTWGLARTPGLPFDDPRS